VVTSVLVTIRKLEREDHTQDFQAPAVFQRFLREFAHQNQERHHVGATYIAATDERKVLGYATVAMASIELTDLPASARKRLPRYPLPALRLGQLAVDERHEGQGIGSALLRHVLLLAAELADRAGCVGVVVDAVPEKVDWYEKRQFLRMEPLAGESELKLNTTSMFLPISTVLKVISSK
jgi:GNAT superfamily N-acetyltransferase